jgi:glucosyl-3-phosphoglycerate synthase
MSKINPQMRKMVVFDLDNTVLQGKFIDVCAKKYNFRQALALLQNIDKNSISLAKRIGSFLKAKPVPELVRIADEMPVAQDIPEVVKELKQRQYTVGIITDSYDVVASHITKKIGADFHLSYQLQQIENISTGEVIIPPWFCYSENSSCNHPVCKTNALRHICRVQDVPLENCIVAGDSESDLCMLSHAGVSVAFCTSSELLKQIACRQINKRGLSELLAYAP